jgi:DNA-binding GntR family transcriptional regulator
VENASPAQRRALAKQLATIDRLAARDASILEAKDRFYDILFVGGGNVALHQTAASLHARIRALRSLSLSLPGRARKSVAELHDIIEAIDSDDAEKAARACRRHVANAGAAVTRALSALT